MKDGPKRSSRATLEIVGEPGGEVLIFADLPPSSPPPIFEGSIPEAGSIRLRVPRKSLRLVVSEFGVLDVQFDDEEAYLRVDVRVAKNLTRKE